MSPGDFFIILLVLLIMSSILKAYFKSKKYTQPRTEYVGRGESSPLTEFVHGED